MNPRITIAIPLYKSARFFENICENIETDQSDEVEFIVSDRHCYDDTIDRIAKRFSGNKRVICIKKNDEIDWVGNINELLKLGSGDYFRILPHDDISPAGSLSALINTLDTNKDAVLAYGPTECIDLHGKSLPTFPQIHLPFDAKDQWTLGIALELFWKGYFNGAFKGLLRREKIIEKQLFIKSTKDQVFPERCWLFALSLLGKFEFVDHAVYIKRIYKGSTHSKWRITHKHFLSVANTMSNYTLDIIGQSDIWTYANRDIWYNAMQKARWLYDCGVDFNYTALPSVNGEEYRNIKLPVKNIN